MSEVPQSLSSKVTAKQWAEWSEEQRAYLIKTQGSRVEKITMGPDLHERNYGGGTWELDKARPNCQEVCSSCNFPLIFYSMPRRWSMSPDADVWNIMKCGHHKCQRYIESCL